MTDGNTGIQVAPTVNPPQEDEMAKAREFFNSLFARMADTVVDYSKVRAEIKSLTESVESLKSDVEYTRNKNRELDAMLSDTREQRDNARRELASTKDMLSQTQSDLSSSQWTVQDQTKQIESQRQQIATLTKERDTYGLESMQHKDEADKWKARATQATAKIADLASLFKVEEEPKAEAQPEPKQPEPYTPPPSGWGADPAPQPEPSYGLPKPTEPEPIDPIRPSGPAEDKWWER